jgi:hypothetical protein
LEIVDFAVAALEIGPFEADSCEAPAKAGDKMKEVIMMVATCLSIRFGVRRQKTEEDHK